MIEALETIEDQLSADLKKQIYYIQDKGGSLPQQVSRLGQSGLKHPSTNPATTAKVQMRQPCYCIFTSGTRLTQSLSDDALPLGFKSMAGMGLASMRM